MATVNFINRPKSQNRGGMKTVLEYTMKPEKAQWGDRYLVSGLNCTPQSVYQEFINTKLLYGKDSQRMYYHFVQSFHPDEVLTPETAHEIALKLAEFYADFEVLVCTHTDRDHLHSHFIVNSVSHETGKKLHQSATAIQEIRDQSDQLCLQYNLTICRPKQQKTKPLTASEYHTAARGASWKLRLANTIDQCMCYARNREIFIELMESEGYKVHWTDSRKYITYQLEDGKKCRDNKLHEEKYLKERMEQEFAIRTKIISGGTETAEPTATSTRPVAPYSGTSEYSSGQSGHIGELFEGDTGAESATVQQTVPAGKQDRFGEFAEDVEPTEPPIRTGWEKEREACFSAENQAATMEMVSAVPTDYSLLAPIVGTAVGLACLGENADGTAPIKDATTMPQPKRKRKQGKLQNKEDEQDQNYNHTMTMY